MYSMVISYVLNRSPAGPCIGASVSGSHLEDPRLAYGVWVPLNGVTTSWVDACICFFLERFLIPNPLHVCALL